MKSPQSRKQKSWTYSDNGRSNLHPGLVHPVRQKHIKEMKEIKVQVPEGITEFSVQVNGETATVVYETKAGETGKKEEWQPQDGEIVFATHQGVFKQENFIFPFGHMKKASMDNICREWDFNIDMIAEWTCDVKRPATEKEKKMFHDALKEKGLRWNAEEKRVEKLPRWRAEKEECYYYVSYDLSVSKCTDWREDDDDRSHECGNYFKTMEAAERVAGQVREIFKNSKAE